MSDAKSGMPAPNGDHVEIPDDGIPDPFQDAIRGTRFIMRYEHRSHIPRLHPSRLWRLVLGIGLVIAGIINAFIPGPGGSLMLLAGLFVLAGESKILARMFDWAEVRFSRQVDWALRHKILALCITSACALTAVTLLGYAYTQLR